MRTVAPKQSQLTPQERRWPWVSILSRVFKLLPRWLRERLIRSMIAIRPDEVRDITVQVASTVGDLEAAAAILHDAYVARGYTAPHESGVRVTPHLILPTTTTFVAKHEGRVIATMSLILDGPLGLPVEAVYGEEVVALRSEGRRLAEVGALCVAKGYRRRGITVLLNKLMWRCAAELLRVDDLLIAIHPEAEDIYRGVLAFHRIGPRRAYPGLNKSAIGVLMRLALPTAVALHRKTFGTRKSLSNPYHVFTQLQHDQILMPAGPDFLERIRLPRLSAALSLARARPDAFADLTPQARSYLSSVLPAGALPPPAATDPVAVTGPQRSRVSGLTRR